ncbi:alpha,alpha-trehalase TreF [Mangrovibacterium lignilyticum]|uniref:alpha,alpha-trehalase TreF n=1 Tax=Mangrovibacterium lignilyticum TaxID=2668052 RepID=UPI0013D63F5E|nr:alpha,alpha-trehalase TreF [Mangrovibacterium lignilyticum]
MINNLRTIGLLIFIICFCGNLSAQVDPLRQYPQLFSDVQLQHIFKDQKTFVDCNPKIAPDSLESLYKKLKLQAGFSLKDFVGTYFDTLQSDTTAMLQHLHFLWNELTRQPDEQQQYSTLLPLPNSYIIPGGRFKEIYYWDSYFTMLGLQVDGKTEMIRNMVDNFAFLIDTYGHIPNGNRSYYLSRSQPPFFALMVEFLASATNDENIYRVYLDAMEDEYNYWMAGEKVVHLENGVKLNRYWDEENTPRPESYGHDAEMLEPSGRDSSLFRDIRSAAESGWDFSTRWFEDGRNLQTIQTTQLIPVDLNCLLYKVETILSKAYKLRGDEQMAASFFRIAGNRKKAILQYCWNAEQGFFSDYNLATAACSPQPTLAGLFPLFVEIANPEQAEKVISKINADFLKAGGLVTTLVENSGQQWDYPNGWAPLQWVGYIAFKNYGNTELSKELARRWIRLNAKVYFETGKMKEKYDVVDPNRPGGGGEYEGQDGFGWTNGVFLRMWNDLHTNEN